MKVTRDGNEKPITVRQYKGNKLKKHIKILKHTNSNLYRCTVHLDINALQLPTDLLVLESTKNLH